MLATHICPDIWSPGRSDKQLIMMHEVLTIHTLSSDKNVEVTREGDYMSFAETKPASARDIQELNILK